MKKAKIEFRQASNGQFYFVVKSKNGKILATGETYHRLSNAANGARALLLSMCSITFLEITAAAKSFQSKINNSNGRKSK